MPYITREDGVHFVIPSYRDTLVVKQKSTLKNEILLLSQNYGEFITLQKKGVNQYEVAFSPDTGYLLGESVWFYFNRPLDLIYCEAIPNTTEALLVIVKAGSVYLDGRFPMEGIPEELIIFLTQQNNFEIYIYGDVPISKTAETGKFTFEEASVKSFTILDKPVFPTLPLYKNYQLQLVEPVLRAHRIGVFPLRQLVLAMIAIGAIWMAYSYLTSHREVLQPISGPPPNPYIGYNSALTSPSPDVELKAFLNHYQTLFTITGWAPATIDYTKGNMTVSMKSSGGTVDSLMEWANRNKKQVNVEKTGFYLIDTVDLSNRLPPKEIYSVKDVIATLVDRLASVYPGNHLTIGDFNKKPSYTEVMITVRLENVSPLIVSLIAQQLSGLPVVLQSMTMAVNDGSLTGTMVLQALGN